MVFRKTHAAFQVKYSSLPTVLLPGHPELPLDLRLLGQHHQMSSILKRSRTLPAEMAMVPKPQRLDFSSPLSISSVSANSTESTAGSVLGAELQPIGKRWELKSKRRPLVERRQGRCVPPRGIYRSSAEWANHHVRSHHRLGNARASPGRLARPGIDQGRGTPTPSDPKLCKLYGPRPWAMRNTIQDSARASKSLIHTPILRRNGFSRNGSILMRISLAIWGMRTDPPLLCSAF